MSYHWAQFICHPISHCYWDLDLQVYENIEKFEFVEEAHKQLLQLKNRMQAFVYGSTTDTQIKKILMTEAISISIQPFAFKWYHGEIFLLNFNWYHDGWALCRYISLDRTGVKNKAAASKGHGLRYYRNCHNLMNCLNKMNFMYNLILKDIH